MSGLDVAFYTSSIILSVTMLIVTTHKYMLIMLSQDLWRGIYDFHSLLIL